MPWEAKDLSPGPTPPGDNAAPLLRKAAAVVDKWTHFKDTREIRKDIESNNLDAAAKLLAGYALELSEVEKASRLPRLDFYYDPDMGPIEEFPELSKVKSFVGLLCLRAQLESLRSDPNRACQDIQNAWRLSNLTGQGAGILPMLIQIGCQNIVLDGIQRCAAALKTNPSGLKDLAAVIGNASDLANFRKALRGEAYLGIATTRNPFEADHLDRSGESTEPGVDSKSLVRTGLPKDAKWRGMMARHLEAWTQIKAAMDKYGDDTDKLQAAIAQIIDDWGAKTTISYMVSTIMMAPLPQSGLSVLELDANWVATRALLEAMQIRAHNGKWPVRIEDIPGTWTDPFNGKPLKLKVEGDAIKIYSVGPNRKDDGGTRRFEITDDAKKNNFDDVASYPPRRIRD
jgi:hypothetical protein